MATLAKNLYFSDFLQISFQDWHQTTIVVRFVLAGALRKRLSSFSSRLVKIGTAHPNRLIMVEDNLGGEIIFLIEVSFDFLGRETLKNVIKSPLYKKSNPPPLSF